MAAHSLATSEASSGTDLHARTAAIKSRNLVDIPAVLFFSMEQEAFLNSFLNLASTVFDPLHRGVDRCQAKGVSLGLLLDFRPHALSGVSWCASALSALGSNPRKASHAIHTYIEKCISCDSLGISTHPTEPPSILGNLAATTLAILLDSFEVPLPDKLMRQLVSNVLRAHDRSLRPLEYTVLQRNSRQLQLMSCPLPLLNVTLVREDSIFCDEVDVRLIYGGLISAMLAKALQMPRMDCTCNPQSPPSGTSGGWQWGDAWKRILSAERRSALLRTLELAQCPYTGGFGRCPGSEAHGGYTYCAVSSISLLCGWKEVPKVDTSKLKRWLCERCLPSGGISGRSGKAADVCYSFWVAGAWLNLGETLPTLPFASKRVAHIMSCMNPSGGISKSPANTSRSLLFSDSGDSAPDPFHTCFGLVALSLHLECEELRESEASGLRLTSMDSFTALPISAVASLLARLAAG